MQPNQQPDPSAPAAPPAAGAPAAPGLVDPVVEFVRTDRQSAGYVLVVLSGLLLVLCVWTTLKAGRTPAGEADKEKEQEKMRNPFEPDEVKKVKPRDPARGDYISGAILAAAGFLLFASAATYLFVGQPRPTEAAQRTDARGLILAVGGLFGALLIVSGVWFFYKWNSSLFDWLDKNQTRQAKWVLIPFMAIVVGAAIMFLATLPARADERHHSAIRKLVYGTNMGLGVLLLFVALVVINLVISPRVPNRLDTTEQGFYSLSQGGHDFLAQMGESATIYVILPEGGRDASDIRRLVQNCQDASGGKITVKSVDVSNQAEYQALKGRFQKLELNDYGVLLAVGEDERRNTFIRADEFFQGGAADPRDPQPAPRSFVGESKLLRELQFLLENEQTAVVYFTQSAGELDISGGPGGAGRGRSAMRLREYLERNYLKVLPLKFDLQNPKVPDDATVLVVAQPTRPLDEKHVAAIRKYMTEPRPDGKKGKLIVLSGAAFAPPPEREVLPTGLEGLLAEFGVQLEPRVVMSFGSRQFPAGVCIVEFSQEARNARNPVATALGEKFQFVGQDWRAVGALRTTRPDLRAVPLMETIEGDVTWLEDRDVTREIERIAREFIVTPAVRVQKQFSDSARTVAVAVSDGDGGRVVVIGNGLMVSDGTVREARGKPPGAELVGGSIDWVRDRPPLSIEVGSKKYVEFRFPAKSDETRGLYLPLLLALTAVVGLGVSMWAVRRRTR